MALGTPKNNPSTKWQTVACSGAQKYDITNPNDYLGQGKGGSEGGKPRLEGYNNATELKAAALNEFIPGREKQIEFVKKYKPKVITLTMGGNDVGFGDKIKACLFGVTCDYVTTKRHTLKSNILQQYDQLKSFYEKLYDASGRTAKIYVLGYPQFINGNAAASCEANVHLDDEEREMAEESVSYFNRVIRQAANRAGVKFIDVENSLDGGKLCDDGQKYMTGIAALGDSENQESFHPNAKGHFEMAMTVWDRVNNESLLDYDICPDTQENVCPDPTATKENIDVPSYFASVSTTNTQYNSNMTSGTAKKSSPLSITTDPFMLRPSSTANVTLYSDPINLGDFTVAADGSLEQEVQIPNSVPAGYHTLVLTGETYSGESIEYEQIILVQGANPDDLDENGISDSQQPCGPFMVASDQDADFDGIDDACDPRISAEPELYRVRSGDGTRIYEGQAEKEHYLYIERNTHASDITGITGDYDPDGDGWAVVGVSKGVEYTATTAPDTGPSSNFEVLDSGGQSRPYVYIRAGGWGCVSFTPSSLSKVVQGQPRVIKQVAANTNNCRQEAKDEDVDANGLADNEQPLYVARNGDSTKGEDPARIYLFRNFYAAESQLGVSDYTPTGTAANTIAALPLLPDITTPPNHPIFGRSQEPVQEWNLLATSKANEYIPAFNKLIMTEDSNGNPLPIILTKKQNGQCIAYKPQSTSIIKFNQQNTLMKMAGVPEGENCE